MNKAFGLGLVGLGIGIGVFIGKNHRLVRRTGRRIVALKDDAHDLMDSAGEWIDKGKSELSHRRKDLESVAETAAAAFGKLTA